MDNHHCIHRKIAQHSESILLEQIKLLLQAAVWHTLLKRLVEIEVEWKL
jgi:hypothetical protein